ncbi:hypothetical protein PO124_10380 [Bacillus licheniformis]|nr:hypothetical protein [Bacillus licheniformis]
MRWKRSKKKQRERHSFWFAGSDKGALAQFMISLPPRCSSQMIAAMKKALETAHSTGPTTHFSQKPLKRCRKAIDQ